MQKKSRQTDYSSHYEKFLATGEIRCIDDEIPFDIPDTWEWVRFGEYVRMKIGKTPARGETAFWSDGIFPWVSIADMSDYGIITKTKEKVSKCAAQSQFGEIIPQGTLLMSFKLTVGRTSILGIDAYHNEAIISIYPYTDKDSIVRNYLFYTLPLLSNLGDSKDAIKGKTLNSNSLYKMLLPIPPLKEQYRIIEHIKKLLPIINLYAKSQNQLDTLNNDIKLLLRKSILQEAIQGKLVPQIAEEGTAEELLEQIKAEKQKLVKEGKLKAKDLTNSTIFRGDDNKYYEKCGNITTCIDDEIPFEIPNSWCWVRGKVAFLPMQSIKPQSETFCYIDIEAVNNKLNTLDKVKMAYRSFCRLKNG